MLLVCNTHRLYKIGDSTVTKCLHREWHACSIPLVRL
uniref:Uncharacterized protein n=1 Tax=Anguilla anguilla TaxID=7936 RepID=A0A0E9VNW2_ANGAN